MVARPGVVASFVSSLALTFSLVACDRQPERPTGPALTEASNGLAFAKTVPSLCADAASQLVDLSSTYSGDVRNARNACRGGACEPQVAATMVSFGSLKTGQDGFVFACTPATAEVCDNADNDKDGSTDEDFADKGTVCSVGVGACLATGVKICSANQTGTTCSAQPGTPSAETCDNADNDCNGSTDETFADKGSGCQVGVGLCMRAGVKICSVSGTGTTCSAVAGSPSAETCDNYDNDCDGSTDETFVDKGSSCTVGVGACMRAGVKICSESGAGTMCSAQAGTPTTEVCDTIDNDCDGTIDEGCGG